MNKYLSSRQPRSSVEAFLSPQVTSEVELGVLGPGRLGGGGGM